ncbi:glutathione S-transferase [Xylariomycetidae sp. FL2044]|nr:glutathione S-transferase [Xylariomycetidae sp. FL2044]
MAPFGKVWTYPNNYRAQRVYVAGELGGLEVTEAEGFEMRKTNQSPDFLAKFPMGKVPAFEGADGFCVAESAAMLNYVARSGSKASQLLGLDDPKVGAKITEWTMLAENELASNAFIPFVMAVLKVMPADQARFDTSIAAIERAARRVEVGLEGGKKFLVGDQLTVADIMIFGVMSLLTKLVLDAETRKTLPNLTAYMQRIAEMPEFKKHFGALELCEKRVALP